MAMTRHSRISAASSPNLPRNTARRRQTPISLRTVQPDFTLFGLRIRAFYVMHGKLPVLAYRFDSGQKAVGSKRPAADSHEKAEDQRQDQNRRQKRQSLGAVSPMSPTSARSLRRRWRSCEASMC